MKDIICWWSGGVTSAVACKMAIDLYGVDRCQAIFIDTKNEDDDTYRFKKDCEKWYGIDINTISRVGGSNEYQEIKDVWYKYNSLNVAHGAICSSELKREVRLAWQKDNDYDYQVFGFDIDEPKRAKSMKLNYPEANPIYPLLMFGYSKKMAIQDIEDAGIEIPRAYKLGFHNNNCLNTGCVQGGLGYWGKMEREIPENFNYMAQVEHDLTDRKGKPVTMNKDQSKSAKDSGRFQVFLKPHPDYPEYKCLADMNGGREPRPLFECNGFGCAVNDLEAPNETDNEIHQPTLFDQ